MSENWTKGPWTVDDANPTLVAAFHADGTYDYVCAVQPSDFAVSDHDIDREHADARLIASAPELYDCVMAALNMVDGNGAPPDWDRLRAIAKKARGETKEAIGDAE